MIPSSFLNQMPMRSVVFETSVFLIAILCGYSRSQYSSSCSVLTLIFSQELLLFIPFTGNVKLKAIRLLGGADDQCPTKMRAYTNRDDLDFDTVAQLGALQEWDIPDAASEPDGLEFETRISKFQGVHALILHIPSNAGADTTKVRYIGLRGECRAEVRRTIITLAESAANPADHKETIAANMKEMANAGNAGM